jgi:hypothetical protein
MGNLARELGLRVGKGEVEVDAIPSHGELVE